MVAVGSKCRVCKEPAIIDLPRHNAHFCADHFLELCRRQVVKAIEKFEMVAKEDRILVAVSGGKDSLAVWDILLDLGYQADGLYIGLGIGDYSETSAEYARAFATERNLKLIEVSLRNDYGYDVPTAAKATKRVPCSACGISKRHLFDKAALDGGYTVLVTGHNMDDEAAVLFGNTLRWDIEYLARQSPVLPARNGFPKKVKPLIRLTEREMAAWCIVRGIDYLVDECPMALGNKHIAYKEALNAIEHQSPGSKAAFYLNFLDNMSPLLAGGTAAATDSLLSCVSCGAPTTGDLCAFCRVADKARAHEPVPVELVLGKGRGRR
ncbi:MAG TPA: ATP-binding protein [Ilumatobacteraceae bacterium]|nr:ATP-binding protein [Ilumatobacteraceae bacterium]HRB04176.1 ATP-binding protein [Ilumatobacteraceae bacterium]